MKKKEDRYICIQKYTKREKEEEDNTLCGSDIVGIVFLGLF